MTRPFAATFILASASPRRRELLKEAGYNFKVTPPDIDESAFSTDDVAPCEYAKKLALAKAKSVAAEFPDSLVVGADTVVDFDGEIIGKPRDVQDAKEIIRRLFSRPHKVITAIVIVRLSDGLEMAESDTTIVYPKKMTEKQIVRHIEDGSWRGKAGAYAIQASGDEFVEKIDGSLSNVMGLPMELLRQMLERIGSLPG
jgi:septum formation protein